MVKRPLWERGCSYRAFPWIHKNKYFFNMVHGSKWASKMDALVGTSIGTLRFLESLEPPGGKSKVLGRFVTF